MKKKKKMFHRCVGLCPGIGFESQVARKKIEWNGMERAKHGKNTRKTKNGQSEAKANERKKKKKEKNRQRIAS